MICQVNLFSGELINAAADFSLRGWLPIDFTRVYKSNSSHLGVLGHGWVHTYDVALRRDNADFVYRNEFGVDTRFAAAQEYAAGDQTPSSADRSSARSTRRSASMPATSSARLSSRGR